MKRSKSHDPPVDSDRPSFGTTNWSLILAARDRGTAQAADALCALCGAYWYPLYAFIRRWGHDPDRAADLTQEFFARFLEKGYLESVDRSKGRFRAFLLAACQHFLANAYDRDVALKRGGGRPPVSIDRRDAEGRYLCEPTHDVTPERLFERRWALTLLDRALDQVGREFTHRGKGVLYDRLKVVLTGMDEAASYARLGDELGMTENAVKKAAQPLRQRYREVLRELVAETRRTAPPSRQQGQKARPGEGPGIVKLWDSATRQFLATLDPRVYHVHAVLFAPDRTTLAVGGQSSAKGVVLLWDVASRQERTTFEGHAEEVNGLAFSPHGSLLATAGGAPGELGQVKVWDLASHQERAAFPGHGHVAFSPDGSTLAFGSDDGVVLRDIASARQRLALGASAAALSFSPDGRTIATAGGSAPGMALWQASTGQELITLNFTYPVTSVAFSPDGASLAVGSGSRDENEGTVLLRVVPGEATGAR